MARKTNSRQHRWHVLIAEDDPQLKSELLSLLKPYANCKSAVNGEEALKIYHQSPAPFDFILLDVTMPVIDGFEVLKMIRQNEEEQHRPPEECARIIILTAFKDSLMENYNLGWNEFITKPVDFTILLKKMKEANLRPRPLKS